MAERQCLVSFAAMFDAAIVRQVVERIGDHVKTAMSVSCIDVNPLFRLGVGFPLKPSAFPVS